MEVRSEKFRDEVAARASRERGHRKTSSQSEAAGKVIRGREGKGVRGVTYRSSKGEMKMSLSMMTWIWHTGPISLVGRSCQGEGRGEEFTFSCRMCLSSLSSLYVRLHRTPVENGLRTFLIATGALVSWSVAELFHRYPMGV